MSRKLLFSVTIKDCDVQTFRSGGPGGQHQNKTESGVRVIHRASGAVGESRETRSQHANKRIAFDRLAKSDRFVRWVRLRAAEIEHGKSVEQRVEEQMSRRNLAIQVQDEFGKWVDPLVDYEEVSDEERS